MREKNSGNLAIVIFFMLLILMPAAASLPTISEIMYNPKGSDTGREWVEIYTDTPVNFSGFTLYESNTNHNLALYDGSLLVEDYVVIADNPFAFLAEHPHYNKSLFDSSFSLSNSGEEIMLKNGSEIFCNITYLTTLAYDNGNSLQMINGSWQESLPTPGEPNNIIFKDGKDILIESSLETIFVGKEYSSLFKVSNLDHAPGINDNINLTIFYNITYDNILIKEDIFVLESLNSYRSSETGSFTAHEEGNYTICGLIAYSSENDYNPSNNLSCITLYAVDTSKIPCNTSLNITSEKLIYDNSEPIKFYNWLDNETFPFTISYWIEDLFGNIIKAKSNTSNTNQKSYTPHIDDSDLALILKSDLIFLACNNTSPFTSAEKLVIVKGTAPSAVSTSVIDSINLGTDSKAKFGESVKIRLKIYKGDTSKNQIKLYVQDSSGAKISDITYANLYSMFSDYELTLPVQIDANCRQKFPDAVYDAVLEGFDSQDTMSFQIAGIDAALCITETVEKEVTKTVYKTKTADSSSTLSKAPYELLSFPEHASVGEEISLSVLVNNDDSEKHDFTVWSYIYKGSRCISGEREQNLQKVSIPSHSSITVNMKNNIFETDPGDYKVKVKIIKDKQKTAKEITESITISEPILSQAVTQSIEEQESALAEPESEIEKPRKLILSSKPIVVYESSTAKARNLVPLMLILALLMPISFYCIFKLH